MNFCKFLLKRPETNYRFYQKNSLKNLPELEYCLIKILVYQSFESLDVYPKFLIFKLLNVSNKDALPIVKDSFAAQSTSVIKNSNIFQKNSVYPKTFYLHSFLLLTSTSLQNL